ncbi:hypothetical protein KSP39_PZI006753 [Platanthera zijinensis]|uniref:Uncharacterized protein n=1 Tax=Platanthera zijinensis TaxID=2320716 RepID=A0AAP0G9H3_9ASPA
MTIGVFNLLLSAPWFPPLLTAADKKLLVDREFLCWEGYDPCPSAMKYAQDDRYDVMARKTGESSRDLMAMLRIRVDKVE